MACPTCASDRLSVSRGRRTGRTIVTCRDCLTQSLGPEVAEAPSPGWQRAQPDSRVDSGPDPRALQLPTGDRE